MKKVFSRIIVFCSAALLSFSNAAAPDQQTVHGSAASSGGRDYVIVSLGDSYSAGEGNEPFFGQNSDDKHKNPDWVAHRSEKAWSGRLTIDTSEQHINGHE